MKKSAESLIKKYLWKSKSNLLQILKVDYIASGTEVVLETKIMLDAKYKISYLNKTN